jgi:hypothetical protein
VRAPSPVAAIVERVTGAGVRREVAQLREQLGQERESATLLAESVADLERALTEPGWTKALASAEVEFTAEGMVQLRAICRLYAIKNPLIKRGLALRSAYVWGQGVEITARANGKAHDGEQDVQAVVAAFLADPGNQRAFTGPEARDQLERSGLGCEGEVFIVAVTRPLTGEVQARIIPPDEITLVVSNPDDASEPWFYKRCWNEAILDPQTGSMVYTARERFYPALEYRPLARPMSFGRARIAWDSPVLHVTANRPHGWQRGIPDAYAAIDWAKAYKEFLEDWARLMKSLSRYAWKATTKGSAAAQVRARLAQAPSTSTVNGDPLTAGATALLSPDAALEAINKSGATIDAESGRPLAMMVASALGIPVTMLLADPGQTGARATAETLDQPTELEMSQRRDLWAAAYRRLVSYVITESVRAPQGALKGTITRDRITGRETLVLAGGTQTTVDIDWPDLDDADPVQLVEAIVKAAGTATVPPEVILRLLLTALGVRNVDTLVEAMLDDDGEFVWPTGPPLGGLGSDAANRERNGQDPAGAGPGSMQPDRDPDDDLDDDEPDDDEPEPPDPDEEPV